MAPGCKTHRCQTEIAIPSYWEVAALPEIALGNYSSVIDEYEPVAIDYKKYSMKIKLVEVLRSFLDIDLFG